VFVIKKCIHSGKLPAVMEIIGHIFGPWGKVSEEPKKILHKDMIDLNWKKNKA
jgi:hypothetical protein